MNKSLKKYKKKRQKVELSSSIFIKEIDFIIKSLTKTPVSDGLTN